MGIIENKTKSKMMNIKNITLAVGVVDDIGDWTVGAAGDIGDWTVGAAGSIADFASDETDTIVGGVTGVFTAKGMESAWDWLSTTTVEATEAGIEQVIAIGTETPI